MHHSQDDEDDPFDIIIQHGEEVFVVEVKTILDDKLVDHFVENLLNLKTIFPEYSDAKVYGAVAYIVSDANAPPIRRKKKALYL